VKENVKKVLVPLLPVVIIVSLVFVYKGATREPHRESGYDYTTFGIDDGGTIYTFEVRGPGLHWPVEYEGKELKPLYGCSDCGHLFPGNIGAMTTRCPECESSRVGGYDEEVHGPLKVEPVKIKIKQPK